MEDGKRMVKNKYQTLIPLIHAFPFPLQLGKERAEYGGKGI